MNSNTVEDLLKIAYSLDQNSKEAEAIKYYKAAIKMGLDGDNLRNALICLSSSYRNVGKLNLAKRSIELAQKTYPNDATVILFAALIESSLGNDRKAIHVLSSHILKQHVKEIDGYVQPLKRYYQNLLLSAP